MSDAERKNLSEAWQEALTARIIQDLREGVPTWCKPWRTDKSSLSVGLPRNAFTGRLYTGGNILQLWALAMENGYRSHQWATYQQAQKVGAKVRKGAKATQVIYVNFQEKEDKETKEAKRIPFLRVFWVFNLDQLDGVPVSYFAPEPMLPESEYQHEAARYAKATRIQRISYGSDKAAYYPAGDCITMPNADKFTDVAAFSGTLMHEVTHASGHPSRLNRKFGNRFGNADYAFEELCAELGSAFFCAHLGIPPTTRTNAAYIKHWLQVLENDHRAIVSAAAYASQAFAFMDAKVVETWGALEEARAVIAAE